MEPAPLRRPRHGMEFVLGLLLGAIPLAIWMIYIGQAAAAAVTCRTGQIYCSYPGLNQLSTGLTVYGVLWFIQLVATLMILADGSRRFLGYGLLAMLVAGPIVGGIACINYQALPVTDVHASARPLRGTH